MEIKSFREIKHEIAEEYPDIPKSTVIKIIDYGNNCFLSYYNEDINLYMSNGEYEMKVLKPKARKDDRMRVERKSFGRKIRNKNRFNSSDYYYLPLTDYKKKQQEKDGKFNALLFKWKEEALFNCNNIYAIPNVFKEYETEKNPLHSLRVKDFSYEGEHCQFIWEGVSYRLPFVQHTK